MKTLPPEPVRTWPCDCHAPARAATLLELLACMAILSVIMLMLGTMLEASLGQFRRGVDLSQGRTSARAALRWLEQDLAAVSPSRVANLPRLPREVGPVQRGWLENRIFFPFEINRRTGTGMPMQTSFQNAAPEFASLAFVARVVSDRSGDPSAPASFDQAKLPVESIVGYYVAYSRNSPLAEGDSRGMKLFRHFRPGGPLFADGYARGFLLHCSREINDARDEADPPLPLGTPNPAAVRRGEFENADLPFLLARRLPRAPPAVPVAGTNPWPQFPVPGHLAAAPPGLVPDRGTPEAWSDPSHPVHETVFPDEPLCDNVVRFELAPYRHVEIDGKMEPMDARALNQHLGLSGGEEWPCLVAPDFVDLLMTVVDASTASQLTHYEDWIVDWEDTNSANWSRSRLHIEKGRQDFQLRLHLRPPSRP